MGRRRQRVRMVGVVEANVALGLARGVPDGPAGRGMGRGPREKGRRREAARNSEEGRRGGLGGDRQRRWRKGERMKGKEYIRGCGKEIRAQRKTIRDLPRGAHTGGYRKLGRWNLGKHARRRPRLQANAHFHRRGRGIPIHRGFFGNYPIFLGSRLPLSDSALCTCRTGQPGGWLMGGPARGSPRVRRRSLPPLAGRGFRAARTQPHARLGRFSDGCPRAPARAPSWRQGSPGGAPSCAIKAYPGFFLRILHLP